MQTAQSCKENKICQECKRLKIKCSRTIPCDQCVRRGVEEICPDGKLRGGRQGRYLLATSETLHEENKALKLRIRALEQALETSHSDSPHPLLEPHLLTIARPYLVEETTPAEPTTLTADEVLVNRFGTMHIESGKDRWLGPTSLSEIHLNFHDKEDDFIPEIDEQAKFAAPFSMLFPPPILNAMALQNLPSKVEAWSLLETFYENATYAYGIIRREDFIKRVFSPVYSEPVEGGAAVSLYQTSAIYSVLALGALHDLSRPIYSPITREWMEISQSLLMASFGSWQTSLDSIESVMLLCYLLLALPELELSKVYFQSSWALKMAQTIGLHRNPEELGVDEQSCRHRRFLFSEICLFDASESLLYGRPFTMSKRYIADGAKGYGSAPDRSAQFRPELTNIMEEIADHFMEATTSSSYSTVLNLDRKLRALQPPRPIQSDAELQTGKYLRDFMHCVWYYSTLLTLHKPYFALGATQSTSDDTSGGKLSPSIFASYEAATNLLQMAMALVASRPGLLARLSLVWPHLSTCMVVLYGFGIHMPFWFNTMHALNTADACMSLVYLPSTECVRAKQTLPYLSGLQQKAHSSFLSQNVGGSKANPPDEIAGLPAGISVHLSNKQPSDTLRESYSRRQPARLRGARALAVRQANAYIAIEGQFFGDGWFGGSVGGPGDMSSIDINALHAPVIPSLPAVLPDPDPSVLFNLPAESEESTSSTSEQISQLQLQQSWSDFLLQL